MQRIAILEKDWKNGRYGKKVEKEARELFENKPIAVTECLLSSSKYLFKFKKTFEKGRFIEKHRG